MCATRFSRSPRTSRASSSPTPRRFANSSHDTWCRRCGGRTACVRSPRPARRGSSRPGPETSLPSCSNASIPHGAGSRLGRPTTSPRSSPDLGRSDILGLVTRHATITGVGSVLPSNRVPNTWFEDKVDTTDAWIRDRTGIEARHFAEDGVVTSDLAVDAATRALETAGVSPAQIDLIVCATVTGDTPFPSTAVWVQQKLGLSCPAFDVNAACAGFSYALATVTGFVEAGMADTVLLIGAEVFSRILNFTDRQTCVLFGDGAGAAIVQAADRPGIEGTVLGADGSATEILIMPAGGRREPATPETAGARRAPPFLPERRRGVQRAGGQK